MSMGFDEWAVAPLDFYQTQEEEETNMQSEIISGDELVRGDYILDCVECPMDISSIGAWNRWVIVTKDQYNKETGFKTGSNQPREGTFSYGSPDLRLVAGSKFTVRCPRPLAAVKSNAWGEICP